MSSTDPVVRGGVPNVNYSRFRTSMTFPETMLSSYTVQGKVIDYNLNSYTVDVVSQFDQLRLFDIQVGAPYLHWSRGEGIWAFPDVGAKCMVTIPSDSSPPFVSSFIMPPETIPNAGTEDAPEGTRSHGGPVPTASDFTYAGGRPRPKPGDIWLQGRDGNFVRLHRGGVLQVGSSELCQSLYIPLTNLLMDVSSNYAQHTAGGSILWGIQQGGPQENASEQRVETYRLRINDQFGVLRIAKGTVRNPLGVKQGDIGAANSLAVGTDLQNNPVVMEVSISPEGFDVDRGESAGSTTLANAKFTCFFQKNGQVYSHTEASVVFTVAKSLRLDVEENVFLNVKKNIQMIANEKITIQGKAIVDISSPDGYIRLNPAGKGVPVARQGDTVLVTIPPGVIGAGVSGPLPPVPLVITGTIRQGNNKVLA